MPALERLLEILMAVFGAEQDGDVSRADRAHLVRGRIANQLAAVEQAPNLCRHGVGVIRDARRGHNPERVSRRNGQLDGKPVLVAESGRRRGASRPSRSP